MNYATVHNAFSKRGGVFSRLENEATRKQMKFMYVIMQYIVDIFYVSF